MSRAVDDSGNLERPAAGISVTVGNRDRELPVLDLVAGTDAWRSVGQRRRARSKSAPVSGRTSNGFITGDPVLQGHAERGPARRQPVDGHRHAASPASRSAASAPPAGRKWPCRTPSRSRRTRPTSSRTTRTSGFYAGDGGYFATAGVDNGPLHAPARRRGRANGVYRVRRHRHSRLRRSTATNYWVDVVFANLGGAGHDTAAGQ